MNTKTINKNLAMALCLSSVLLSAQTVAEAAITDPINEVDTNRTITEDVNIESSSGNAVSITNTGAPGFYELQLTGNTIIKASNGYALFSEGFSKPGKSGTDTTLSVNPDNDKTVQIIGNIGNIRTRDGYSYINLNLTNEQSYFAGDIDNSGADVNLKLNNGAIWYPGQDEYTLGSIKINADGGVIDLYHSEPDIERTGNTARTFTLNSIAENNGGANGATFRIASDIENGTADKIVLDGDGGANIATANSYSIQVVQDPLLTAGKDVTITADTSIVVATVDGTRLTTDNTTITGKSYRTTINAGLSIADITPTIELDRDNNQWLLNELDIKITANNGGPAVLMAASGAAAAQAGASAWRADNNDLMRRMGELRNSAGDSGAWGKIYGGQIEVKNGNTQLDYRAVQVGYDRRHKVGSGQLFTGLALSHLRGDTSSVTGSGELDSTMFGIYGSYVGDKGHFADLIIKYGRMNNKISNLVDGSRYSGEFGSNGVNISAEYGYRHNFKHNVYIEPQVELTYSNVGSSDYTMTLNGAQGAHVSNDAYKSLIGRIGFTLGKQYKNNNIYLKLGLAHEFQGDIGLKASYNGVNVPYHISGKSTWLEYGIGFNVMANKRTNFYAELEKTTGDVIRTNWRGHLGMRYSF